MNLPRPRRILQIGYGAFGETHLRAWHALGLADRLTIAEPRPEARAAAAAISPASELIGDYREALAESDLVDLLTPTDTHHAIAAAVLDAGTPLLIEKPIACTEAEATDLARRARRAGVLVLGGYYFRYHPKTLWLQRQLAAGGLGRIRLLSGRFAGFKRTRADAGALLNDAVHFLDLFVWLLQSAPAKIYAVTRDHFGRGREDFALLVLEFPDGAVAQIEAGYVQPGRWPDAVVPAALTSKEISVSGSAGSIEIDYAAETIVRHCVHHAEVNGQWQPQFAATPAPEVPGAGPVEVVTAELRRLLEDYAGGCDRPGDGLDGGVLLARILDAARRSAAVGQAVTLAEPN